MDLQRLADRLRNAREHRELTQQSAAEALQLPRTAITQIEAGNRSVSTLELTKLAKLYRYSISYFVDVEVSQEDEDIEVLLYRAAPGLSENLEIKKRVNYFVDLCREGITLEKSLGLNIRSGPPSYSLSIPRSKGEAVEQGQLIAEQERKRLGMGVLSIADLADVIANQGIWASSTDLPDNMSGFFLNDKKTGLIILVNAKHVKSRKRFSYAHEYAHALLDHGDQIRISNAENHAEFVEIRANAFAAAFLMPAEGVKDFLRAINKGKPSKIESVIFDVVTDGKSEGETRSTSFSQEITFKDVAMMAHHFGVSYQAAVYRLRSLNSLLSAKECDQLINQEKTGKEYLKALHMLSDLDEPEEKILWDRELKSQLANLAIEAYRREEISRGRVFELGESIEMGGKNLFDLAQAAFSHIKDN